MDPKDMKIAELQAIVAELRTRLQYLEAETFDYSAEAVGLPTRRTLAAGVPPGLGMAGQLLNLQAAMAEFHLEIAKQDAKLSVVIRAIESPQDDWSPSRLKREIEQSVQEAMNRIAAAQERARARAAHEAKVAAGEALPVYPDLLASRNGEQGG